MDKKKTWYDRPPGGRTRRVLHDGAMSEADAKGVDLVPGQGDRIGDVEVVLLDLVMRDVLFPPEQEGGADRLPFADSQLDGVWHVDLRIAGKGDGLIGGGTVVCGGPGYWLVRRGCLRWRGTVRGARPS